MVVGGPGTAQDPLSGFVGGQDPLSMESAEIVIGIQRCYFWDPPSTFHEPQFDKSKNHNLDEIVGMGLPGSGGPFLS